MWIRHVVDCFKHLYLILPRGIEENYVQICLHSRSWDQDLNPGLPVYEAEILHSTDV
jgi:hypothetical protein